MATGPQIVHKQFNSPIGLYSQQNIKETLGKHLQNLDNGTVGIDFNNPATDKPGNLANSAVLRMLEEEERNRKGYPKLDPTQVQAILDTLVHANHRFDPCWPPTQGTMRSARSWDGQLNANYAVYSDFLRATKGQRKVVWPPVPETNGYHQPEHQQHAPAYYNNVQQSPQNPPAREHQIPIQQYQAPSQNYQSPSQQYQPQQQPPQYNAPSQQHQFQQQHQASSQQSSHCEGRRQEATGLSKLIPVGPGVTTNTASTPFRQGPQSPRTEVSQPQRSLQNSRWAPATTPISPQGYGSQPSYPSQQAPPQYSPQQQDYSLQQQQYAPQQQQYAPQQQYSPQPPQYSPQPPQYSPQPQYSEPQYQPPQRQFEPPPSTITLRQQQPIHQQPPPVFASQPAAASFKGGVNMRGDAKWPPQPVREAVAAENEARRMLAKGPACRPRKVNKDYRPFFAQNALNQNYPGYRAPPGTQHYEDFSGRSSY